MAEFPDTSESLIIQVRDPADQDAWERFEQLYRPVIFRIARAKGLQHSDALDLVQQVLLSVADAIPKYEKRGDRTPFRNWLSRITRNAIVRALTRRPQERASGGTQAMDVIRQVPCSDESIDALIETEYERELYAKAATAVRLEVAESTWLAFEMTVLQSRPIEQTARALGVSTGTIYASRSRVIRRLRDKIKQIGFDDTRDPP